MAQPIDAPKRTSSYPFNIVDTFGYKKLPDKWGVEGGLYLGDGTDDVYDNDTTVIRTDGAGELIFQANAGIQVSGPARTGFDFTFPVNGVGIVLTSPNSSAFRIVVNNAGVLSTIPVP